MKKFKYYIGFAGRVLISIPVLIIFTIILIINIIRDTWWD